MKTLAWFDSRGYLYDPTVSFLLHVHNMSEAAIQIVNDLRQFDDAEIIVMDDGSSHDHTKRLADHLTGVNEFLLHSNDLFDVIVFNRVIGFARGKYVVVIQDDDRYKGTAWVIKAIELFERDPQLAILGGRARVTIFKDSKIRFGSDGEFQYTQGINAAPMWIRRSAFLELGGFDVDFVPMLWHEPDLCLRAWLSGYHVGWYKSEAKNCAVRTKERRGNKEILEAEARNKNFDLLMERHGDDLVKVCTLVEKKNEWLKEKKAQ